MNALVVDTSSWISYFAGKENDDLDLALEEGRVYLPPIVAAELLSGKMNPDMRTKLNQFLQELPLCRTDYKHWFDTGHLRAHLLQKGITISTPDAHIAQCALDLNCYLVSEDAIFEKIVKYVPLKLG